MNEYIKGVTEIITAIAERNGWDYERAAICLKTLCDRWGKMIELNYYPDIDYPALIQYICKCTGTEAANIYNVMIA